MPIIAVIALACLVLAPHAAVAEEFRNEVSRLLRENYFRSLAPDALSGLTRGNAATALRRLDPYLAYKPKSDGDPVMERASQTAIELGIEVIEERSGVIMVQRRPTGADRPPNGAYLVSVNGHPVTSFDEAIRELGHKSLPDPVSLGLADQPDGAARGIVLRRERRDGPSVEVLSIGAFKLIRIFELVLGQTEKAVEVAVRAVVASRQPIVLDLRYSVGGNPFSAFLIAGMFFPHGETLGYSTRVGAAPIPIRNMAAFNNVEHDVIVLTGAATASAAEMLTIMLRGRPGATVVGQATWGKCVIVAHFPVVGGSLAIPTTEVIGRSGEHCHVNGIAPLVLLPKDHVYDDMFVGDAVLPMIVKHSNLRCTPYSAATIADTYADALGRPGDERSAAVVIGKDRDGEQIQLCSTTGEGTAGVVRTFPSFAEIWVLPTYRAKAEPVASVPEPTPKSVKTVPVKPPRAERAAAPVPARDGEREVTKLSPIPAKPAPTRSVGSVTRYTSVFGTFKDMSNAEARRQEVTIAMATAGLDLPAIIAPVGKGKKLLQVVAGTFASPEDAENLCRILETHLKGSEREDCLSQKLATPAASLR